MNLIEWAQLSAAGFGATVAYALFRGYFTKVGEDLYAATKANLGAIPAFCAGLMLLAALGFAFWIPTRLKLPDEAPALMIHVRFVYGAAILISMSFASALLILIYLLHRDLQDFKRSSKAARQKP